MASPAQLSSRECLVEAKAHTGSTNEQIGAAIHWNNATVGYWITQPGRITQKARRAIHPYWLETYLRELPFPEWVKRELSALRAAAAEGVLQLQQHVEARLPTLRALKELGSHQDPAFVVGGSYVLGLSLFMSFTSRLEDARRKRESEMTDALHLLEQSLMLGTASGVFAKTPYLPARIAMQIPGGYYNLCEFDLARSERAYQRMHDKLREWHCIENTWQLHKMIKWDATPLHNGVVFSCALEMPDEAAKFLQALISLDERYKDPTFARCGLSALADDPMVKRYISKLYK
jgi:hypothetical protein